MRIDLFLKETHIIKRRSIAKEYCERELVYINNKIAKPSSNVFNGDIISIKFGDKMLNVKAIVEPGKKKEKVSYENA